MKDIEFKLGGIDKESFEVNINDSVNFDLGQSTTIIQNDYEKLINLPRINTNVLIGNKNGNELDLVNASNFLTNQEIEGLLNKQI